jgi:hypothetical protein
MEHLFCFAGELLLLGLVLYEYVTLPLGTASRPSQG